jgi:hypothetical protein
LIKKTFTFAAVKLKVYNASMTEAVLRYAPINVFLVAARAGLPRKTPQAATSPDGAQRAAG